MSNLFSHSAIISLIWAALFLAFPSPLPAYMTSAFLGGFPGLCEDSHCFDDGQPISDAPADIRRNILQHQLTSPTCPTDLVYIAMEYPGNTGSDALDNKLAKTMEGIYDRTIRQAANLSCNDFEGCLGHCLPVGFEIKHYVQRSGPGYMSLFRVDRFIGNFRPRQHMKGTVEYRFENYSLISGQTLKLKDIFITPASSVPLFWQKVQTKIKSEGDAPCPVKNFRVNDRAVSDRRLEPDDFILTRGGATVALTGRAAGHCLSQAVDLSIQDMLDIGAYRAIWGL